MTKYSESDMQQAILAVRSGATKAKAATECGIPKSTLLERLDGAVSKKQQGIDRQMLSESQEFSLAEWARVQGLLGLPPTHLQLRLAAERTLRAAGDSRSLGQGWTSKFL